MQKFDMKIKQLTPETIQLISGTNWPKNDDTLDLSGHEIDLSIILDAVNRNAHIKHLNLSKCIKPHASEMDKIAHTLKTNQTLQSLDLSDNEINSTLAVILFEALKDNQSLKHLNLKDNHIGDGIAEHAIVNFIKNTFSLESLNISHNGIQNTAVAAIAKALEKNKTLLSLDISNNLMSEQSIQSLTDTLITKNKILIALHAAEQYDPDRTYKITVYQQVQNTIDSHTKRNKTLRMKTIPKSEHTLPARNKDTDQAIASLEFEANLAKKVKRLFNYVFAK